MRSIVSIAGSDSSAGAGIQADIKAAGAYFGCHCATVITAITAQNTLGVQEAYELPTSIVRAQFASVFNDLDIGAAKTGMLGGAEMINAVADELAARKPPWLVVDPVMISKTGFPLLAEDAVAAFVERMLPFADLVTPNTHETERLTGIAVSNAADAERAGRALLELGASAALVKGGHLEEAPATDVLVTADDVRLFEGDWTETVHTHGTGCTYAAAIAARLAHDCFFANGDPAGAVEDAKLWLNQVIALGGLPVGQGVGPLNLLLGGEWHGWGNHKGPEPK